MLLFDDYFFTKNSTYSFVDPDSGQFRVLGSGEMICDLCSFTTGSKRAWLGHRRLSHSDEYSVLVDQRTSERRAVREALMHLQEVS